MLVSEGLLHRSQGRRSVVTEKKNFIEASVSQNKKHILIISLIQDLFFYEFIIKIQEFLAQHGYTASCRYLDTNPPSSFDSLREKFASELQANTYDGVLVIPVSNYYNQLKSLIEALDLPVVCLSAFNPIPNNQIVVDMATGTYSALNYLHQLGCRNLCYLGTESGQWGRCNGVLRFFKDFFPQIDPANAMFETKGTVEGGYNCMKKLLQANRRFDGVVTHNDLCAIGVVMAAREAGMKLPEEMAIIGIDDISKAKDISPSLTTLCQPKERICEEIVRIFEQSFENTGCKVIYNSVLQPNLVIRESTSGFKPEKDRKY
jgi:LacI family transcriptional regulator